MVAKHETVAVLQARMGSTRLPGKMLEDLRGKPLLERMVERMRRIPGPDRVLLATSDLERDDVLAAKARDLGVEVVRGSETRVLERFLRVLDRFEPRYVVRVCGDAPLMDPDYIGQCLSRLRECDADIVRPDPPGPNAYQGASVISARALRKTARDASQEDPLAWEHVTAYAQRHAEGFVAVPVHIPKSYRGEFHLSIDSPEDLQMMRDVIGRFDCRPCDIQLEDVLEALRERERQ